MIIKICTNYFVKIELVIVPAIIKVNFHNFIFNLVVFICYLSNRKKFNNGMFLHTIKTRNVLRSIYHKPSFCYFIVQVSRTICYLHTYIIKQCKKSQARIPGLAKFQHASFGVFLI